MTQPQPRTSGLYGIGQTSLCKAIACALLIGISGQVSAQDAEQGKIGDPESWKTEEFLADWGLEAIGAQYAYARGLTGKGVSLGILDTGTSATHSEFVDSGRLRPITFTYEYSDGYVFDVNGGAGYLVFGDHGTHVGGTIAASRNQSGTHGVAFGADLLAGSAGGIGDSDLLTPLIIDQVNEWVTGGGLPALTEEELRTVLPDTWGVNFLDDIMASNFDRLSQQGARAINNSWGIPLAAGATFEDVKTLYQALIEEGDPTIEAATRAVRDYDTLFVFAAGNNTPTDEDGNTLIDPETGELILTHASAMSTLPAFTPELEANWLTVVSLDESLERSGFSSICGETKDWCVSAPGSEITSSTFDLYPFTNYRLRLIGEAIGLTKRYNTPGDTIAERLENLRLLISDDLGYQEYFLQTGIDITQPNAFSTALHDMSEPSNQSLYANSSGTSMAAPHVTGSLGLLMERFPYLDNQQIRDVLLTTTTDLGEAGVDEIYGWGLVNLQKAIEGYGQLRVDTEVVMNQKAGGVKVWEGDAWDDWSNDIGGPGRLTKSGIGWLRLSGDNSFAGATVKQGLLELDGANALTGDVVVEGGVLQLDGSLQATNLTINQGVANINGQLENSDLTINGGLANVNGVSNGATLVAAGGLLTGTGTLGDTTVQGKIAPGNSIGTLSIDGNYTQAAGSAYLLELQPPSDADLLSIRGTATLQGGSVDLIRSPGAYLLGQSYNILSADGGVSGTFAGVGSGGLELPFLQFNLQYSANAVALDVIRGMSFASAANTPNQRAAASALDNTADDNILVQEAVLLPSQAQAQAALDRLSGDIYPGMRSALIDASRMPREAMLDRARAGADGFAAQTYQGQPNGAWAQVYNSSGRLDSDGNAARIRQSSDAVLAGFDHQFSQLRIGGFLGTGRTDFNSAQRNAKGRANNQHFGVYGAGHWGGFGLRAGWLEARHDIDVQRNVAFGSINDSNYSAFDGKTRQAVVEAGYRFQSSRWQAEPFLQYADVRMSHDRINEAGGATALSGNGNAESQVGIATAGARFAVNLKGALQEQTWLSLRGMLGYRKFDGDDRLPQTRLAFAGGPAFIVSGVPLADNATVAEVGVAARLSAHSLLEASYSGQFADDSKDDGVSLRYSLQF